MKRLSPKQRQRIQAIWHELDDGEVSTERLFAMVSDRATCEFHRDVDDGDIADAMSEDPSATQ